MNQTRPAIRFAKAMCRTVLATILIALMPAAILPAATQEGEEQPRWFGSTDGRSTMLLYGVPDSDYVMLYFSCTVGKPLVSVNVQDEESSAEEGAAMQVRLSVGGEKVEFSEKAIPTRIQAERTSRPACRSTIRCGAS